jgi:hypothetical protein
MRLCGDFLKKVPTPPKTFNQKKKSGLRMPIEKSSANALLRKRCASAQREVYFVFRRPSYFSSARKFLKGYGGTSSKKFPQKRLPKRTPNRILGGTKNCGKREKI